MASSRDELIIRILGDAKNAVQAFLGLKRNSQTTMRDIQRDMELARQEIERDGNRVRSALNQMFSDVDTDRLINELRQGGEAGERAMREIEAALNDVEDEMKEAELRAQIFGTEIQNAARDAERSLGKTEQAGQDVGSEIQQSANKAEQALDQVGQAGERAGQRVKQGANEGSKGMQNAEQDARGLRKILQELDIDLGDIASSAAGAFGAKSAFDNIDSHRAGLGLLMSTVDATNTEIAEMDQIAKELHGQFGDTWGRAFQTVGLVKTETGLAGEALREASRDVWMITDAFQSLGVEEQELTAGLGILKKAFPGSTESENLDYITYLFRRFKGRAVDLQDTLIEYPHDFRMITDEAGIMFGILEGGLQAGYMNTDRVADSIREMRIELLTTGSEAQGWLEDVFGSEEADRLIADLNAGGDAAEEAFFKILSGLNAIEDPQKRNNTLMQIFRSLGEDQIAQLNEAIPLWARLADEQFNVGDETSKLSTQYDNVGSAIERTKGSFQTWMTDVSGAGDVTEDLASSIDDYLIPGLIGLAPWIGGKAVKWWKDWRSGASGAAKATGDVASKTKNMGGAASNSRNALKNLGGRLLRFGKNLGPIGLAIMDLEKQFYEITGQEEKAAEMNRQVEDTFNSLLDSFKGSEPIPGILGTNVSDAVRKMKQDVDDATSSVKSDFNTLPSGVQVPVQAARRAMERELDQMKKSADSKTDAIKRGTSTNFSKIEQNVSRYTADARYSAIENFGSMQSNVSRDTRSMSSDAATRFAAIQRSIRTETYSAQRQAVAQMRQMRKHTTSQWRSMRDSSSSIFSRVANNIVRPFRNLHIPTPHFSVSWRDFGFGIRIPDIDVKWYQTGGVFENPVLFGNAGFGDVTEAIVPFEGPHADRIARLIAENMPDERSVERYINISLNFPGDIIIREEADIERIVERLRDAENQALMFAGEVT